MVLDSDALDSPSLLALLSHYKMAAITLTIWRPFSGSPLCEITIGPCGRRNPIRRWPGLRMVSRNPIFPGHLRASLGISWIEGRLMELTSIYMTKYPGDVTDTLSHTLTRGWWG